MNTMAGGTHLQIKCEVSPKTLKSVWLRNNFQQKLRRRRRHCDSPTATSLFWNIFRNNKACILILLSFASGSWPDLKTTCKICAQDSFLPLFQSLKVILNFSQVFQERTSDVAPSPSIPVPSKHSSLLTASPQKGLWGKKKKKLDLSPKSGKQLFLSKTASNAVELMTRPPRYVCLLLCGRSSLPPNRFQNIVCWFC